jgi:hypothetical protein
MLLHVKRTRSPWKAGMDSTWGKPFDRSIAKMIIVLVLQSQEPTQPARARLSKYSTLDTMSDGILYCTITSALSPLCPIGLSSVSCSPSGMIGGISLLASLAFVSAH